MGTQNIRVTKALSFRENRAIGEHKCLQVIRRMQTSPGTPNLLNTSESKEDPAPMALSKATKAWFNRNELEGFLRIAEAPPQEEPEKVAL